MANRHMKKMFNIISHQGNSNQTTLRYHLTPVRMAKIDMQETNVGEDVEKGDPYYIVGWNASWYSHSGKQCGGPLKS